MGLTEQQDDCPQGQIRQAVDAYYQSQRDRWVKEGVLKSWAIDRMNKLREEQLNALANEIVQEVCEKLPGDLDDSKLSARIPQLVKERAEAKGVPDMVREAVQGSWEEVQSIRKEALQSYVDRVNSYVSGLSDEEIRRALEAQVAACEQGGGRIRASVDEGMREQGAAGGGCQPKSPQVLRDELKQGLAKALDRRIANAPPLDEFQKAAEKMAQHAFNRFKRNFFGQSIDIDISIRSKGRQETWEEAVRTLCGGIQGEQRKVRKDGGNVALSSGGETVAQQKVPPDGQGGGKTETKTVVPCFEMQGAALWVDQLLDNPRLNASNGEKQRAKECLKRAEEICPWTVESLRKGKKPDPETLPDETLAESANVYLLGATGAGKTTVGQALATSLDLPFVDLDERMVEAAGQSMDELVADPAWFRQVERFALDRVASGGPHVVATGSRTPLVERHRQRMRETGVAVYLKAPARILAERVQDGRHRYVQQRGPEQLLEGMVRDREPYYAEADLTVENTGTPDEAVHQIMEQLRERIDVQSSDAGSITLDGGGAGSLSVDQADPPSETSDGSVAFDDEAAPEEELPDEDTPLAERANLIQVIPGPSDITDEVLDWVTEHAPVSCESKYDGFRCLALEDKLFIGDDGTRLTMLEDRLPQGASYTVDGELVLVEDDTALPVGDAADRLVEGDLRGAEPVIFAFDLLFLDGRDLRELALRERIKALDKLIDDLGSDFIRPIPRVTVEGGDARKGLAEALTQLKDTLSSHGLMMKALESPYEGGRSPNWAKFRGSLIVEARILQRLVSQNGALRYRFELVGLEDWNLLEDTTLNINEEFNIGDIVKLKTDEVEILEDGTLRLDVPRIVDLVESPSGTTLELDGTSDKDSGTTLTLGGAHDSTDT